MNALPTVLWRTGTRREWTLFVGGYAALLALGFAAFLVGQWLSPDGDLLGRLYGRTFPVALFFAPAAVSALAAYRVGALPLCIGIGLTPVAVFGVVATAIDVAARLRGELPPGDAPTWGLVLAFLPICLGAALAGFLVGTAARLVAGAVRS